MNRVSIFILLLLFASQSGTAFSDEAGQLDQAIGKVIQKSEYQWRMPHQKNNLPDKSFLSRAIETFNRYMLKAIDAVRRWIRAIQRWLAKHSPPRTAPPAGKGRFSAVMERRLLILLIAILGAVLLFTLWRLRKQKSQPQTMAEPVTVIPDLSREDVSADELPEEGWQMLAQELMQRGELRLALRAFYMSCLSFLGRSELITIAKFKSNREYEKELLRRAHSYTNLSSCFSENLVTFERSWYGNHEVTEDLLQHFVLNQDRIKESVKPEPAYA